MCYKLSRGPKTVDINDKDLVYLVRLVRADVKYLKGRSARQRNGEDANATKALKRQELADKLESVKKR